MFMLKPAAAGVAAALMMSVFAGCSSPAVPTGATSPTSSAIASPSATMKVQQLGTQLVNEFFVILGLADAERKVALEKLLAPEFQVVRADGSTATRDAYLSSPPQVSKFEILKLQAAGAGASVTVSYQIRLNETINGVAQETTAPRLSVFRLEGDSYLLVAHANLGAIK